MAAFVGQHQRLALGIGQLAGVPRIGSNAWTAVTSIGIRGDRQRRLDRRTLDGECGPDRGEIVSTTDAATLPVADADERLEGGFVCGDAYEAVSSRTVGVFSIG